MGYRRMDLPALENIIRRHLAHQSQMEISRQEGFDRKTVRHYLGIICRHGIQPGKQMPGNFDRNMYAGSFSFY